jgi:hypothetical protein
MLPNVMLILGVAALSLALRSYRHVVAQKLGALGILATSFLIGYLLAGSLAVGIACAASWLLLPWVEILTRIRRLRLPAEKNLRQRTPPSAEIFPALHELTEEVEQEGFEHVEDTGWDWDDYQQFFRLFYHAQDRVQAALCLIEQNDLAFYYVSLSSRGTDGAIWTTWNYPFSYSLKLVPQLKINRLPADQSFLQMYASHRDFLRRHRVEVGQLEELDGEGMRRDIQQDMRAQITHNIASGLLTPADEGQVRYSWRGLFYIWLQFLRDLVRLS